MGPLGYNASRQIDGDWARVSVNSGPQLADPAPYARRDPGDRMTTIPALVQSSFRICMVSRAEAVGIVNASQSMVNVNGELIECVESLE